LVSIASFAFAKAKVAIAKGGWLKPVGGHRQGFNLLFK
jgi:hypothetical protein